jgi:hypothetical protein
VSEKTAAELIIAEHRSFDPVNLKKWAKLYPALPLRTVALSLREAHRTAGFHLSEQDRQTVVTALTAARLDGFASRRGVEL